MLALLLPILFARRRVPAPTPRPPAVGFTSHPSLHWASWGTGPFQVLTVAAGPHRWFVSSVAKGFAVERRGPEGPTALLAASTLRGAVARVAFDAWRVWERCSDADKAGYVEAARAAGVPPGFLLDAPVR